MSLNGHTGICTAFQKPGLDGLALAFEIVGRAKAVVEPSLMAWLGPAYFGPAWLGPWPEAGPRTALGANYPQPAPELIDGEKEYEVEEIIADCINQCKRQYLVKWTGYPASKNS